MFHSDCCCILQDWLMSYICDLYLCSCNSLDSIHKKRTIEWLQSCTYCLTNFLTLFSLQAEKKKLQQAGDGDLERVLLLTPEQPLPQRGGQGGAGQEVLHHSLPGMCQEKRHGNCPSTHDSVLVLVQDGWVERGLAVTAKVNSGLCSWWLC